MAEEQSRLRPKQSISRLSLDEQVDQRVYRLEAQVEALKKAVRELADALHEELTSVDSRIGALESHGEELERIQSSHTKAIKKNEERLKRGLNVIADALSALTMNSSVEAGQLRD